MLRLKLMVSVVLSSVLLFGQVAQAEFIGGVEAFNGTTKDTTTWEEYTNAGSISQDDMLIVAASQGGKADFTTKTLQVGFGQAVHAFVKEISSATFGNNALLLTTNSLGTSARATDDSRLLSVQWNKSGSKIFSRISYDAGATEIDDNIATGIDSLEDGYWFQIERLSSTEARFSAFDSSKQVVGTPQTITFSDVPNDLYIALYSGQTDSNWDECLSLDLPEPSTMVMALTGVLGLLIFAWRKRK